jgi:hypothetical protein
VLPLESPPLDDRGEVIPHDHPGIEAEDGVIRRISPQHMVDDPKTQGRRLSSIAFQASTGHRGGMSIDLQRLIEEAGLDPKAYVLSPPWIGAVRFTAGALRGEGFMVGYDPIPQQNPFHGQVWGNFSKRLQRRLSILAEWFVNVITE